MAQTIGRLIQVDCPGESDLTPARNRPGCYWWRDCITAEKYLPPEAQAQLKRRRHAEANTQQQPADQMR